nr:PREDICTED: tyrosine-protein phosphatase non-receptor type 22-like [Latimeria chalumnae]|eukprot:XP_005987680.1 PREDICTED: tyrosine-protein phosphatase non-receptor type 22-like [Latimeria chalumnae]
MTRSKSLKLKSSNLVTFSVPECPPSPSPPPLPDRTPESLVLASEDIRAGSQPSPSRSSPVSQPVSSTSVSENTSSEQSTLDSVKSMKRSKSLKIFKSVKKGLSTAPTMSRQPEAKESNQSRPKFFLKFGFGHRFGKPKGPRNPPPSWEI